MNMWKSKQMDNMSRLSPLVKAIDWWLKNSQLKFDKDEIIAITDNDWNYQSSYWSSTSNQLMDINQQLQKGLQMFD